MQGVDVAPRECLYTYLWAVLYFTMPKRGHPLVCSCDGKCHSKLRILRAAATHYSGLRHFLQLVYRAHKAHAFIVGIDTSAGKGDFKSLMGAIGIESFEELLQSSVDG